MRVFGGRNDLTDLDAVSANLRDEFGDLTGRRGDQQTSVLGAWRRVVVVRAATDGADSRERREKERKDESTAESLGRDAKRSQHHVGRQEREGPQKLEEVSRGKLVAKSGV